MNAIKKVFFCISCLLLALVLICAIMFVIRSLPHRIEYEDEVLFQGIFGREKPDAVRIIDSGYYESRHPVFDWLESWQWYIEFESTDEFTEWILNEFDLHLVEQRGGTDSLPEAPTWFKPGEDQLWQEDRLGPTEDGYIMYMYIEKNGNRVFMTAWGM